MRKKDERNYRGFTIRAHAQASPGGWAPYVMLWREHRAPETARRFDVPLARPCETEDDALRLAMEHGMDLAEGAVPGFNPNLVT